MNDRGELHPNIGLVLNGRYKLVRLLGHGAVGMVYLAEDGNLGGLPVAVKLLSPHLLMSEVSVSRFRTEVLIARKLHHPNIVKLYDFERTPENQCFIVMEYVKGTSLADALQDMPENRLSFDLAVQTLYEIASGMGHAHQHGVMHRDLKPQNVLIGEDGRLAICDFGLARHLESGESLTKTGESVGTPYYMAPELFRGQDADVRTDVYALGIIAYELVSGRKPFDDEVFYSLALKHIETPMPPLPAELQIPAWYRELVTCAAAKMKDERYSSAQILADTLDKYRDQGNREQKSIIFQNWQQQEERRIKMQQRRIRLQIMQIATIAILGSILFWAIFTRFNTRQRYFTALPILWIERYTGPAVTWPIKRIFGIDVSISESDLREQLYPMLLESTVHESSEHNARVARIEMLLWAGVDPNLTDELGRPMIMTLMSSRSVNEGIVMNLAGTGKLNADIRDEKGTPLLHLAIHRRLNKFAQLLIEKAHVDKNATDTDGNNALHLAVKLRSHEAVTAFFVSVDWKYSTIMTQKNNAGYTPLGLALLDRGFPEDDLAQLIAVSDVNQPLVGGKTALILAVENDIPIAIEPLLLRGAKLDARDDSGRNALYYAGRLEHDQCLKQFACVGWSEQDRKLLEDIPPDRKALLERLLEEELMRNGGRNPPAKGVQEWLHGARCRK